MMSIRKKKIKNDNKNLFQNDIILTGLSSCHLSSYSKSKYQHIHKCLDPSPYVSVMLLLLSSSDNEKSLLVVLIKPSCGIESST